MIQKGKLCAFFTYSNIFFSLFICCSFFMLSGCLASKQSAKNIDKVFYPASPAPPRVQFLRSYSGSWDIEKKKSAFDSFVTGKKNKGKSLIKPYGVAIQKGKIYVCDTEGGIMVFDLNAKTFLPFRGAYGMGKLVQPFNIAIDTDGTKYVADPVRKQIIVYDKNDLYIKSIGRPGKWKPTGVAVNEDRVYVVDLDNKAVKVFDKNSGEQIKIIGQKGDPQERLGIPTNIVISDDGTLYVSDVGRFQVLQYDRDGHFLEEIGGPGQSSGYFSRPKGIAVDKDNNLFAVDAAFNNVQLFDKEGQMLMSFGKGGNRPGDLYLPAGIHIDYDNIDFFREYADPNFEIQHLLFVTNQYGDNRLNVYGFGKDKTKEYPDREILLDRQKEGYKEFLRSLESNEQKQ